MEVQRVCVSRFNINNVFLLPQKLCGQFYLHQVFVLGMLLMKLLYTRRFCGNVNSAKLRSCAKTSLTPVTRIHCNIVTGRDEWCNLNQGPHIPVQLPANKSNNYRLCAAINLHKSAGIFRLNPNPFARVNSRDCSSNLPPQCLNWQSKQLIKTLPSPSPTPPPPQRNIQKNKYKNVKIDWDCVCGRPVVMFSAGELQQWRFSCGKKYEADRKWLYPNYLVNCRHQNSMM